MSKKENTTGTAMATEIIRDMKRREAEAIGELSGILMDLDKVLYTLEARHRPSAKSLSCSLSC